MTILVEPMHDTAGGFGGAQPVTFKSLYVRQSFDGTGMITRDPVRVTPVNGILTTEELDPGPTLIKIGPETRLCEIPDSGITLRLLPIWDGGQPFGSATPSPFSEDWYIRNGGSVYRFEDMSEGVFASLASVDPNTLYIVFPS